MPKGEPEAKAGPAPQTPPPNTLWRDDVDRAIEGGVGRFLSQHVEVEASLDNGQFRGWRIVRLWPPDSWTDVDLRAGDVVTSINGMPLERDTQAYEALMSLKKASELRVAYFRGGEERVLTLKIVPRPRP